MLATRMRMSATRKSLTFRTSRTDASDGPSYNYTSVSIGDPSASRRVIIGATGQGTSARTITSIAVTPEDGPDFDIPVNASQVVYGAGAQRSAAIWIAHVPTGSSATIDIVWNSSPARCSIGVWTSTGLESPTPIDFGSGTGNPASVMLDTAVDGFTVAMYGNSSAGSVTWTNATERFESSVEGDASSGADVVTDGSALTIQASHDNTHASARCMVAASW